MITLYALIASVRTFCRNHTCDWYISEDVILNKLQRWRIRFDGLHILSLMNTTWSKIISSGSGNAVIQNFRGNYIVVGGYGLVMEIDPTGNILWGKNIQVFSVSSRLGDSVISGAFYSVIFTNPIIHTRIYG